MIHILCVLAVWRVCHLITKENGPFKIVLKTRKAVGDGFFGQLMDCMYCLSVWVALPLAVWTGHSWQEMVVLCLAFSGGACIIDHFV